MSLTTRVAGLAILAAACGPSGRGRSTGPEPMLPDVPRPPASGLNLPPVAFKDSALSPRVQYPPANAVIGARDSTFIFGSTGTGRATLTINGAPVPVAANGAWLAYLPVPPRDAPTYEIVAAAGSDTVRLSHPVRIANPAAVLADTGRLVVDSGSAAPREPIALRDTEMVRVSVRAPRNAMAWVEWPGGRAPLVSRASRPGQAWSRGAPSDSGATRYAGDAMSFATELPFANFRRGAALVVARGVDTVRLALASADTAFKAGWVILGADSTAVSDTDRVVAGRPTPGGTTMLGLLPGTVVEATGRSGAFVRVRLDAQLEVWVDDVAVRSLPAGAAPPRRVAGNARVIPADEWADLVIPMAERPAFSVEPGQRSIGITLFGTTGNTEWLRYVANDSTIRSVHWEPLATDRVRYTLELAHAPFGHLVWWERGALVVRVRREPIIDPRRPLSGLILVVDAGHPPAGATGPTGLYEGDATLPIALELERILRSKGAMVVMTRTTPGPLALADRPIMSRRSNGHAFVSIHLNAFPDGVNPFTSHGTGTYFYWAHSAPLARAVQNGMVARMGLPNLGMYRESFAVVRSPYMPAVLAEGAFLMFPDQEHALRTREFQRLYALGVADGLEAYFRSLGGRR